MKPFVVRTTCFFLAPSPKTKTKSSVNFSNRREEAGMQHSGGLVNKWRILENEVCCPVLDTLFVWRYTGGISGKGFSDRQGPQGEEVRK